MRTQPPLSITALSRLNTLHRNPPSIQDLSSLAHGASDYPWFRSLITRYLPDDAPAIFNNPSRFDQFRQFLTRFEAHYFPLSDYIFPDPDMEEYPFDWAAPWTILRDGVPYHLAGFSDEDFHSLWEYSNSPGLPSIALLCDLSDHWSYIDNGLRLSWLDSASELIPQETLQRIPAQGFTHVQITAALTNSPYQPALTAIAWLFAHTGNFFLDNYFDGSNFNGFSDPWEPDILAHATSLWLQANSILANIHAFTDWLERDLPANFALLLQHILDNLPLPTGDPKQ